MASLFTTSKNAQIKTTFGKGKFVPFYLQFVPGQVIEVATHPTAFGSNNHFQNTNSILAIPHIQEGTRKTRANLDNDDRYIPLMRGMFEVPSKGDPVLLCEIAGIKYYLGPLNVENNPNFNEDNLFKMQGTSIGDLQERETNIVLAKGQSVNFKKMELRRLAKIPNSELDEGIAYNETYGDLMLEGRHGNSIRVGSRHLNPYIMISNYRPYHSIKESLADGSLISITRKGTLAQHYGDYKKQISVESVETEADATFEIENVFGFTLASDYTPSNTEPPARLMGDLVSSINGGQSAQSLIYDYDSNQILFSSDRLTLNSKLDDIFLSSNKDIHIGAKENVAISTAKDLIIESENTHLGDPNKKEMDNMVLGSKVQEAFTAVIDMIKGLQVFTQAGNQSPLPPSISTKEGELNTLIKELISQKHKIESN